MMVIVPMKQKKEEKAQFVSCYAFRAHRNIQVFGFVVIYRALLFFPNFRNILISIGLKAESPYRLISM